MRTDETPFPFVHREDTFADKYDLHEKVSISNYPLSASVSFERVPLGQR
jgi:hypothetical protein